MPSARHPASHDRLSAFYTVALALGLREGEALALRWEDVDLDRGTLSVTHTLQRVKGQGLQALDTKTERSRRTLRMPDVVVRALREHRLRQIQDRLLGGSRWRETGYVFTTTVGTPVPDSNLGRSFHRIRERLGLPRLRIHDLRHSCATLLLAQGIPARTIMDTLGHSAITTTLNIYGHVTDAMQDEAARAMDRALGSSDAVELAANGRASRRIFRRRSPRAQLPAIRAGDKGRERIERGHHLAGART